eukprot:g2044.t1
MEVVESKEPSNEIRRELAEVAAIAAGAAMQHGLGKDVLSVDEMQLYRRDSIGHEVAEIAVKKGLVRPEDVGQIPLSVVNEIATLAASSAISKGTPGNEELPSEKMEEARQLAMKAAEAAIQRKLVPDERKDPTLADLAAISRRAAGAAVQKGLPEEDQTLKDEKHEHQRQELAQLAAGAAIQQGYGTDRPDPTTLRTISNISKSAAEAAAKKQSSSTTLTIGHDTDAMEVPRTPPVPDMISKEDNGTTETTDLVNKEQSEKQGVVYRESEVEEKNQPTSCFCFAKCFKSS